MKNRAVLFHQIEFREKTRNCAFLTGIASRGSHYEILTTIDERLGGHFTKEKCGFHKAFIEYPKIILSEHTYIM